MSGSASGRDVLYLHGFASSPGSAKALAFRERLEPLGFRFAVPRLDGGDFSRMTLGSALAVAERTAATLRQPLTVIGSSMGGYLALSLAAIRRVARAVVMAPALDMPESFGRWLTDAERAGWEATGWLEVDHHETGGRARIAWDFVTDARRRRCVEGPVGCPTLVFHGRRDDVVPVELSERLAAADPRVRLRVMDDDHSLLASLPAMLDEAAAFLADDS